MSVRTSWLLGLALASLLVAPVAVADIVQMPAEECPEGGTPRSDHVGRYCGAWHCGPGSLCPGGQACSERALCVAEEKLRHPRGNELIRAVVVGRCPDGTACPEGATCQTAAFCGPAPAEAKEEPAVEEPEPTSSGRCSQLGPGAGVAALLTLIPVVARRRR